MKKKIALLIAAMSLAVSMTGFGVFTFAWLTYRQDLSAVNVDAGDLKISNLSTTVYKYVYPHYMDAQGNPTDLVDYMGEGTVTAYPLTTTLTSVGMNIYDPTLLIISGGTLSQSSVSSLNTNLVFKITFTVTYSTPISLTLSADRDSSFVASSTNYPISRYLNYIGASGTEVDALSTTYTGEADVPFYKVKGLADTLYSATDTTHDRVKSFAATDASTSSSLTFFTTDLVTSRPSDNTEATFTEYINIDYDYALTSASGVTDFYDIEHLGKQYLMGMDYHFLLKITQEA